MKIFGILYLFFQMAFFKVFSYTYAVPTTPSNYNSSDLQGFDNVVGMIENGNSAWSYIYNIFAWLNVFIDMDFIFNLLFLTTLFYGLKFALSLSKHTVNLFK